MSFESKSILARLLSKENISVQRGNFPTAFFDVENRVLGIPAWKDMGKDVYDLLIGHEVGHALFTPAEGWHDSATDIPGIPRSYVNVVEDVRIEKLIQRQYPGLVSSFKRGYSVLNDMDFFGIDGRDVDSLSLVDRINLKAKLRDHIDVSYSAEEQSVVDIVMSVETWNDVIEACKVLYAFMKDNQEEKQPTTPTPNEEATLPSPSDMPADTAKDFESDDATEPEVSGSSEAESVEEEAESAEEEAEEVMESETDESFRSNESKLIDETVAGHCLGMSRAQLNECVVPLQTILDARKTDPYNTRQYNSEKDASYSEFQEETKRTVSVMAKEFEMRKAAFRTLRAQTSRSGSIDTSRLHSYKFNDDIFSRVTTLADAKSHGLVMFIDYSASMCNTIRDVIKQVLNMAVFAKKVNIPFEVYGFTNPRDESTYTLAHSGHINHLSCQIMHLLSSSMKRSSFESAMADMYNNVKSEYEQLCGTPLIETFLASTMLIKDFQAKHKIQKTNVIFMTDGFGHTPSMFSSDYAHKEISESSSNLRGGYTININGKATFFKSNLRGLQLNKQALDVIRAMPGVHLTGFFLVENSSDFKSAVYSASNYYITHDEMRAYKKELNTKKFVAFSDSFGYDDYYIVDGRNIDTTNTAFDVSERASKAMITKAFKKHTNSKKGNRVLATKLAQMIAA